MPPRQFGGAPPVIPATIKPFESGHKRAVWTMALLAVAALTSIASAGANYSLYRSVMAGNRNPAIAGGGAIDWANNLAIASAIAAFCMWTHRVYRNLPALGARGLRYTPAWAVGWLFVPLVNLVVPFFVFSEIWRHSIPAPTDSAGQRGQRVSPLLVGWWIVNILPFVLLLIGCVALVVAMLNAPLVKWFFLVTVLVPLTGGAAAILAIFVVRRIDKNQQAKFEMVRGRSNGLLDC
jgi:hypothetical protein